MAEHPLDGVVQQFSRFAIDDVLAKVGALLLMPENAERAVRLELAACAAAAAVANAHRRRPISANTLRGVVNGPEISDPQLTMQEDPVGGWFVEAVTFTGGSYLVLPGITSHATFVLRHLGKAIGLPRGAFSRPEFETNAQRLFLAVLSLSDEIARRAGLRRGVVPLERPGDDTIFVPRAERLEALSRAVTFSRTELEGFLRSRGANLDVLEPMTIEAGTLPLEGCNPFASPLQSRPIVRVGDKLVVACPSLLLAALRHHVICMAKRFEVVDELAARFHGASWNRVVTCLRHMDIRQQGEDRPCGRTGLLMVGGLFGFDSDKALYVCLVTDDLRKYDESAVFGECPLVDIGPTIDAHFRSVVDYLARLSRAPNEVLCLLLSNGVGRSWAFGMGDHEKPMPCQVMLLGASELETISLLEGDDSLLLWRFAKAQDQLRDRTNVISSSSLDRFGCWRDRGYSFYLSDKAAPTALYLHCDWEGTLYREALDKSDPHGVMSWDGQHVADVVALHGTRDVPVYVPERVLGKRVALLVEGFAVPLWIVGPEPGEGHDASEHSLLSQLGDALGYWLWQVAPSLKDWLDAAFRDDCSVFVIRIAADGPLESGQPDVQPLAVESAIGVEVGARYGEMRLIFRSGIGQLLDGPDNEGEKALMLRVLHGIRDSARAQHHAGLPDDRITTIIAQHASPPLKKKVVVVRADRDPVLDESGLPPCRLVSPSDESDLLDELGEFLRTGKGLQLGLIPDERRTEVLNAAVEFYYKQLVFLVASLSPESLLEWLVSHHEAVLRETEFRKLILPTQLECYETHESLCKQWNKNRSDLAKAGLAVRFVIEYVTAQPPCGIRPMSASVHDRLLALANEVMQVGFQSDIIHLGLADAKLRILPSGRLGRNFDSYDEASKAFMAAYSATDVAGSAGRFRRRWSASSPPSAERSGEIDDAALAEFGHTLTDLSAAWGTAGTIAMSSAPGVCRMSRASLVTELSRSLSWAEEKVANVIDSFALARRRDFLSPPRPFSREDVYPWRFTRQYSYLRRPFLLVDSVQGTDVVFAHRHLYRAWEYLLHLCFGGRLQARHPKMKELVSRLNSETAELFNDKVADALSQIPLLVVRRRVKKVGKLRGPLGPPGDIDVLVADRRTRTVLLLECKDLALARTPREMAHQLQALFVGEETGLSTVQKHLKRAEWAIAHLREVLTWLGLGWSPKWRVEPLIVLDHLPMSASLAHPPIAVTALDSLLSRLTERVG